MTLYSIKQTKKNIPAIKCVSKVLLLICLIISSTSWAQNKASTVNNLPLDKKPKTNYVAIIIDDLGYKIKHDQRAVQLPGKVTFAFLPHTPHVKKLAETVHSKGNEIMLHLPMQSVETLYLGPGALTNSMNEQEFKHSVLKSIQSIPYVKGINNHMGSLMTSQKESMQWLMDEVTKTDLFFVDSRTTADTVAEQTANQYNIRNTRRNVFLDHERNRPAIEFQFERLIRLAKKNGSAVAIGHPFPETLKILEEKIPQLEAAGIQLITVSELIKQNNLSITQAKAQTKAQKSNRLINSKPNTPLLSHTDSTKQLKHSIHQKQKRSQTPWQMSLSRSPGAVKN